MQTPKISKFKQTTRTIALFAKNQNPNKLPNPLTPSKILITNAFYKQNPTCVRDASIIQLPRPQKHKTLRAYIKRFSDTKSNGRTQRVHNPVTPFAKYSNYIPKPLKLPKTLQTPKIQNLGKQRERSLCSRKQPNFNKPFK